MTAASLRQQVIAARMAQGMTATALQRASGLSARTLRDIEDGNPSRRYSVTTLASLDEALGWDQGTAWRTWQSVEGAGAPDVSLDEIAEQMVLLRQEVRRQLGDLTARLADDSERPAWASEVIDLMRLMSAEDRRRVVDLMNRLAPR